MVYTRIYILYTCCIFNYTWLATIIYTHWRHVMKTHEMKKMHELLHKDARARWSEQIFFLSLSSYTIFVYTAVTCLRRNFMVLRIIHLCRRNTIVWRLLNRGEHVGTRVYYYTYVQSDSYTHTTISRR